MVLSFDADGSQAVTDAEVELFAAQTDEKTYWCKVFCNDMMAGDTYIIRTYVQDENASTTRVLYEDEVTFSDIEDQPTYYIPPVPTNSFRVTMEKLSGTDRTFTWRRGTY